MFNFYTNVVNQIDLLWWVNKALRFIPQIFEALKNEWSRVDSGMTVHGKFKVQQ